MPPDFYPLYPQLQINSQPYETNQIYQPTLWRQAHEFNVLTPTSGTQQGYPNIMSQFELQTSMAITNSNAILRKVLVTDFHYAPLATPAATPAQRRARRRQAKLDDLAAARAKALLLEHLSADQLAEYEERHCFHVISQGGRVFRIKYGSVGNVFQIGLDGNEEHKYCIHARDQVPHEDNMLAQMLLLRHDEEQFLAVANRHW